MVSMVSVITRPQNRGETVASISPDFVEQAGFAQCKKAGLMHFQHFAAVERNAANVDGVAE
jgi:hypothetical protein